MNLYPLNLVLAVALAAVTLFFGYLPTRRLTARFFTRWTLRFGGMWLAAAALTPPEILHYYVLLALVCFIAWWWLHGGHGLGGKIWLGLAAGFGLSLGPVLILAVTPGAWPDALPAWAQTLFLASLYTGGAIPGLAFVLFLFTRREGIDTGVEPSGYAKFLVALLFVRAFIALINFCAIQENVFGLVSYFLLLPILGRMASRRVKSPRPSTAGPVLWTIIVLGFMAEVWALSCYRGL